MYSHAVIQKAAIFAFTPLGAIAEEAMKAAQLLRPLEAVVDTIPMIKPIDRKQIEHDAQEYSLIVTAEKHATIGGLGGAISEILAEMPGSKATLLRIGLPDIFSSIVGSHQYLREQYNLSSNRIAERIEKAWKC